MERHLSNVKYSAARIIWPRSLCILFNAHGANIVWRKLKPEEVEIWRLFPPTMDNITGKEMTVLIMIHYRRYLRDSHIRLFRLSGHGLVPPDKRGSTAMKNVWLMTIVYITPLYTFQVLVLMRGSKSIYSHIFYDSPWQPLPPQSASSPQQWGQQVLAEGEVGGSPPSSPPFEQHWWSLEGQVPHPAWLSSSLVVSGFSWLT